MATAVLDVEGREESQALGVKTSRTLGALASALAAAQAEFPAVSKDRTANVESKKGEGSSYSYAYADLADVLSAVRPHLAKNGLAVLQPMAYSGAPFLVTCLVHSSGEWIQSEYKLTEYERPQDMGSAITYARRYALTALLGIAAEEDDDGARAQVGKQRGREPMPDCPQCETSARVIVSKFGPGFYCHTCKGKFGAGADAVADGPTSSTRTVGEDDDTDFPNDPTAFERHGVEPAKAPPAEKVANPACPTCGNKRTSLSRYPKKGKFYCGACTAPFGPTS